jgi:parvulin-like peptidyl-prolyl isomerase
MRNTRAILSRTLIPLCALLLAVGCSPSQPQGDAFKKAEILALVNNEPITMDELENNPIPYRTSTAEEIKNLKQNIFQQLMERKLLLQEARRRGLRAGSEEVKREIKLSAGAFSLTELRRFLQGQGSDVTEWESRLSEELLIKKLLDEAGKSAGQPSKRELRAYYEGHMGEFREPAKVHVRHILVKTEKQARILLTVLKQGVDFKSLSRKKSISPDRENGGDWGLCAERDLPEEFSSIIFGLALGEVSPPVKSAYGAHLFFVEDRQKARVVRFDAAREGIHLKLMEEKRAKAVENMLSELKKNANVKMQREL